MTTKQILATLYTMALEAAGIAALLGQASIYDYALASDGARVNVWVGANTGTTGIVTLNCGNETYQTTDFNHAAQALHNALS